MQLTGSLPKKRMNIGIVLSGGMAKGAYQIGALHAIEERLPTDAVRLISASSVGVLNAYAFATGNLKQAEQMWEDVCSDNCRKTITQMLRSSLLQRNISCIVSERPVAAQCLYCTLLDIHNRKLTYKNLKSVSQQQISSYLRASVAMPIYNRAVQINGEAYFDGAMVDNIPVYPLLNHPIDYLFCVYFDDVSYRFENAYFDNKIVKITFPNSAIFHQSVFFKKERIHEMIGVGYERTDAILSRVFADGFEDMEAVYRKIEASNHNEKQKLRVTGDMLVTNLNRVTQRLTARKVIR